MTLYVVRHGQTDWNIEGRIQGHTDIELNEVGREQAKEAAKNLKNIPFDFIISSPLTRALNTAKIINKYKNLRIQTNGALIERFFGDFEGKKDLSQYNCNIHMLLDYDLNYNLYNIEPIQDLYIRVRNFIEYCKNTYTNESILIVTHNGIAQMFELILHSLPFETNLLTLSLKNCEYRKYEINKNIE